MTVDNKQCYYTDYRKTKQYNNYVSEYLFLSFHPSFSGFALTLLPLQNMQRQRAITEAIAIIEGTIYFFILQSFFLYRFSFFSASIGLSFLTLLIEYIIVTNTTRNTLRTAIPIATQGSVKFF